MNNSDNFRIINGYAMRNGITLGIFGILTLACFMWSLSMPFFSILFNVMVIANPVLGGILTFRFRKAEAGTDEPFSFMSGFLHAIFMGFYASMWVALCVFVYLQYFDHGMIFAAYAQMLDTPEMEQYLQLSGMNAQIEEMTGGTGVEGLVEAMRSAGAAPYATFSIYLSLILGPFISAIIGLSARRR